MNKYFQKNLILFGCSLFNTNPIINTVASQNPFGQLVHALKSGNQKHITELYLSYRAEFCGWLRKKYLIDAESALDIYQESVTTLIEKCLQGQLDGFEGEVKTYLFGIGKNRVLQMQEKQVTHMRHQGMLAEHQRFLSQNEVAQSVVQQNWELIRNLLTDLGEPCRPILEAFYYNNLSMEQIASRFGYKNETVARSTKKRCMEKIRILAQKFRSHE